MKFTLKKHYEKFETELKLLIVGKRVNVTEGLSDKTGDLTTFLGVVKNVDLFYSTYSGYSPCSLITFEDGAEILVDEDSNFEII